MTVIRSEPIAVCSDCNLAIAGYDSRETGDNGVEIAGELLAKEWPGWTLVNGRGGESDLDEWFSWHSCDGCERDVAGMRVWATALMFT